MPIWLSLLSLMERFVNNLYQFTYFNIFGHGAKIRLEKSSTGVELSKETGLIGQETH